MITSNEIVFARFFQDHKTVSFSKLLLNCYFNYIHFTLWCDRLLFYVIALSVFNVSRKS